MLIGVTLGRYLSARFVKTVRVITFNKVGHWVQVERADEFNRYSLAFLDG